MPITANNTTQPRILTVRGTVTYSEFITAAKTLTGYFGPEGAVGTYSLSNSGLNSDLQAQATADISTFTWETRARYPASGFALPPPTRYLTAVNNYRSGTERMCYDVRLHDGTVLAQYNGVNGGPPTLIYENSANNGGKIPTLGDDFNVNTGAGSNINVSEAENLEPTMRIFVRGRNGSRARTGGSSYGMIMDVVRVLPRHRHEPFQEAYGMNLLQLHIQFDTTGLDGVLMLAHDTAVNGTSKVALPLAWEGRASTPTPDPAHTSTIKMDLIDVTHAFPQRDSWGDVRLDITDASYCASPSDHYSGPRMIPLAKFSHAQIKSGVDNRKNETAQNNYVNLLDGISGDGLLILAAAEVRWLGKTGAGGANNIRWHRVKEANVRTGDVTGNLYGSVSDTLLTTPPRQYVYAENDFVPANLNTIAKPEFDGSYISRPLTVAGLGEEFVFVDYDYDFNASDGSRRNAATDYSAGAMYANLFEQNVKTVDATGAPLADVSISAWDVYDRDGYEPLRTAVSIRDGGGKTRKATIQSDDQGDAKFYLEQFGTAQYYSVSRHGPPQRSSRAGYSQANRVSHLVGRRNPLTVVTDYPLASRAPQWIFYGAYGKRPVLRARATLDDVAVKEPLSQLMADDVFVTEPDKTITAATTGITVDKATKIPDPTDTTFDDAATIAVYGAANVTRPYSVEIRAGVTMLMYSIAGAIEISQTVSRQTLYDYLHYRQYTDIDHAIPHYYRASGTPDAARYETEKDVVLKGPSSKLSAPGIRAVDDDDMSRLITSGEIKSPETFENFEITFTAGSSKSGLSYQYYDTDDAWHSEQVVFSGSNDFDAADGATVASIVQKHFNDFIAGGSALALKMGLKPVDRNGTTLTFVSNVAGYRRHPHPTQGGFVYFVPRAAGNVDATTFTIDSSLPGKNVSEYVIDNSVLMQDRDQVWIRFTGATKGAAVYRDDALGNSQNIGFLHRDGTNMFRVAKAGNADFYLTHMARLSRPLTIDISQAGIVDASMRAFPAPSLTTNVSEAQAILDLSDLTVSLSSITLNASLNLDRVVAALHYYNISNPSKALRMDFFGTRVMLYVDFAQSSGVTLSAGSVYTSLELRDGKKFTAVDTQPQLSILSDAGITIRIVPVGASLNSAGWTYSYQLPDGSWVGGALPAHGYVSLSRSSLAGATDALFVVRKWGRKKKSARVDVINAGTVWQYIDEPDTFVSSTAPAVTAQDYTYTAATNTLVVEQNPASGLETDADGYLTARGLSDLVAYVAVVSSGGENFFGEVEYTDDLLLVRGLAVGPQFRLEIDRPVHAGARYITSENATIVETVAFHEKKITGHKYIVEVLDGNADEKQISAVYFVNPGINLERVRQGLRVVNADIISAWTKNDADTLSSRVNLVYYDSGSAAQVTLGALYKSAEGASKVVTFSVADNTPGTREIVSIPVDKNPTI